MHIRCVAVVLLASLAASCGPTQIDPAKAEREIARDFERQVEGASVTSVTCPDRIGNEPGTKAVCTMSLSDGRSGKIEVRVRGDGNLRWDVVTRTR